MQEKKTHVKTIDELSLLIKKWYSEEESFKEAFIEAIKGVKTIPNGTDINIQYDWKEKTIDDLCMFFKDWHTWNPGLETGLEYIQRFSWLYYENPKGLEFVTKGHGLLMTYYFVEVNANKMNSTLSIPLAKEWEKALGSALMDKYVIPVDGYQSFNEFFSRELKTPRSISNPDNDAVVVSPADAIINMIDDNLSITQSKIEVKTQNINVVELLNNSELSTRFEGGTAVSCILMPNVYHRYHSPVSGKVVEANQDVAGEYFGISDFPKLLNGGDVGYGYDYSVFEHFRRGYTIIETEEYGFVAMIPVGLNTIASVIFNEKFKNIKLSDAPVNITKGEEIGYFQYGGSMNILLFEKGIFPSIRIPQGQILGKMAVKFTKFFTGTWADLNGTKITVTKTPLNSFSVNYENNRGPFIGYSYGLNELKINFTDDGGIKTGVIIEEDKKYIINWDNNTKWVKQ